MADSEPTTDQRRVHAIGDLHGEAPSFLRHLLLRGLVSADDERLPWRAREALLVQTGDIPDRGPDTVFIARAITAWRAQGARILTLLGNHDVPYLLTDDPREQRRRAAQALPYMVDERGDSVWVMADAEAEYTRQAEAITELHRHPDGGLLALRIDEVLFMHAEPHPRAFREEDYAALADGGRLVFDPEHHTLSHPLLWGRAYSCGTFDVEGGYVPETQGMIPPARNYAPQVLALHEHEPAIQRMYAALRSIGVRVIVHGHVPGPTVRSYTVCGVEHFNIDEAINPHYRQFFAAPGGEPFVPRGWSWADGRRAQGSSA